MLSGKCFAGMAFRRCFRGVDKMIKSLFETTAQIQGTLFLMLPWDIPGTPSQPWKNAAIFKGDSVDYGFEPIC